MIQIFVRCKRGDFVNKIFILGLCHKIFIVGLCQTLSYSKSWYVCFKFFFKVKLNRFPESFGVSEITCVEVIKYSVLFYIFQKMHIEVSLFFCTFISKSSALLEHLLIDWLIFIVSLTNKGTFYQEFILFFSWYFCLIHKDLVVIEYFSRSLFSWNAYLCTHNFFSISLCHLHQQYMYRC